MGGGITFLFFLFRFPKKYSIRYFVVCISHQVLCIRFYVSGSSYQVLCMLSIYTYIGLEIHGQFSAYFRAKTVFSKLKTFSVSVSKYRT